jgi:hypothetical protein
MPTYKDISTAFAKYCEDSWQLRDNAFRSAQLIFAAITRRGDFPKDALFPYPTNLDDVNQKTQYTVFGATRYNPEKKHWEFGLVLNVHYKDATFPREFLRIAVAIKQTKEGIEISLPGSQVISTLPLHEGPDTEKQVDVFADAFCASIVEHYTTMRDRWLEDENDRKIMGFRMQ